MSEQALLKTSYDDDPLMYGLFIDCLRWAMSEKKLMDEYRQETGDRFSPANTPEGRMIDQATGNDLAFLQRFSDWVEANVFGTPDQVYGDDA